MAMRETVLGKTLGTWLRQVNGQVIRYLGPLLIRGARLMGGFMLGEVERPSKRQKLRCGRQPKWPPFY